MPFPFEIVPALATAIAPAAAAEWRFHAEDVLGTRLDVAVRGTSASVAQRGLEAALAEIARLERLLSWRDPASELARLNQSASLQVSADLFAVLARAAHWRAVSGGAFDERLGQASRLWRAGDPGAREAALAARAAEVRLDPERRIVRRDAAAVIDLDAIAKGYVIDRALAALRGAAPEAGGALVSIGGDMAGWSADPARPWRIGLPRAGEVADNAPLDAVVDLVDGAVATSGRGARDMVVNGRRVGPALSGDGEPADAQTSVTARAACAMDADALATIGLILPPDETIAIAERAGAAVRINARDGAARLSPNWLERPARNDALLHQIQLPVTPAAPAADRWPIDWRLAIWYRAPRRLDRGADFREPYMAVWVTDLDNKPVRTLFMVGRNPKWQKDNFIWWSAYRAKAEEVIDARSASTAPTGRYGFMWDGQDDNEKKVRAGKYIVHIETSRERGGHTHRSMEIEVKKEVLQKTMAPTPDEGGFTAVFGHYNDMLDLAPED